MTPPQGEGDHFSAPVKVPRSAHAVDFVLSNVAEGEGIYDNRGGLDYHLPVEGFEVRLAMNTNSAASLTLQGFRHILQGRHRML